MSMGGDGCNYYSVTVTAITISCYSTVVGIMNYWCDRVRSVS